MRWHPKKRRAALRRILAHEHLESRQLLAANCAHNIPLPEDVDGNGMVTPVDALHVISQLNQIQTTPEGESKTLFLDVTDDSLVTPIDALRVIARLNGPAWKNQPANSLGSKLSGAGPEEGTSRYVEWSLHNDETARLFEVKVEEAVASSIFEVILGGVVVGQLETDEEGEGKLTLSSSPRGNQLPLPDNFPDVTAGTTVSVGDILTGELTTHAARGRPPKSEPLGDAPELGCTPGYWKTNWEKKDGVTWAQIPPLGTVESTDPLSGIFDTTPVGEDLNGDSVADSLIDALKYKGGSRVTGAARILLRSATASYLNASHPEIDFPSPYTDPQAVIDAVNAALASNDRNTMLALAAELDDLNNTGCTPVTPEVDIEKFTRIDVNPINIEKLVRVEGPSFVGDVCDVLGKPVELTFEYIPSLVLDTQQPVPGKAEILVNDGIDDDGTSFVVVSANSGASGNIFFSGAVSFDEQFTAAGSFGSSTYISFFDDQGGDLLQEVKYHTSCSAPINLGDEILSATLVGYVGEDGATEPPDLEPGIGDDDADIPTGPMASPGDTVVFTYVVTNPIPDTALENVMVTDQLLAPDEQALPDPTSVEDGDFNVGDTDKDNRLDFGEVWLYTSAVDITNATAPGQYIDKATVVSGNAIDMDPAYFEVADEPPFVGDVCDVFGKPVAITFEYLPGTTVDTNQDSAKAGILVDNGIDDDGVSFVIVTDENDASKALNGDGRRFFEGDVAFAATFEASESFENDDFGSTTFIHFYDDATGGLLQSIEYHTSCSQPIQLGDVIGNATLVAYNGETGSAELPPPPDPPIDIDLGGIMLTTDDPFDPNNIGEDADDLTGPIGQLGDKITWTYQVTNTGNVALTITSLFDDNESPPLPPGSGDDDFEPAPVLKSNGFNFGDGNDNDLLEPEEVWYFQAMEIATEPGQHKNTAKVTAEDEAGTMVMDDDMSHYIVNPLDIEKLVRVAAPSFVGDVCDVLGKPVTITFDYIPGTTVDTAQDSGKATATGTPDFDGVSYIVVDDGDLFEGTVLAGSEFTIGGSFGSNTVFDIYDDLAPFQSGASPLQTLEYHTSCSQPIQLGDVIGSVTLVGYVGEDGSGAVDDLGPGIDDDDADVPIGPSASPGDTVVFTYVVTNTGVTPLAGAIANVVVTDQELVPAIGPIFNPDAVLGDDGFNVGDTANKGQLDVDEVWLYTSTTDITDATSLGQHTDKATVVGNPVVNGDVQSEQLMDMDPANFEVLEEPPFVGDVCEVFGKPVAITFDYIPGTTLMTNQDSGKAEILFDSGAPDADGVSFVIVTDEDDAAKALSGDGNRYFEGDVLVNSSFEANEDFGEFGSQTYLHFYVSAAGGLLQTVTYHTSCSQSIQLGDVIGNATLVGYVGDDGSVGQTNATLDGVSSHVTSLDALPVVVGLNLRQPTKTPDSLDVDKHGLAMPRDTLTVFNYLNEQPTTVVPGPLPAVESRVLDRLLASLDDHEDDGLLEEDLLDLLV